MRTLNSLIRVAGTLIVVMAWLSAQPDGSSQAQAATNARPTQGTGASVSPAPSPALVSDGAATSEGNIEQVAERYPNGKIKIERQVTKDASGNYVNHGTYTRYDIDGKVQRTGTFLNGKQHGSWTQSFAKDEGHLFVMDPEGEFRGPFASQATFNDGQLDGVWTIKDHNGQNIVEWTFDNGTRNGKWTWWYSNGQKRLEATYQNGKLDGEEMEWSRNGKLIAKNTYIDGRHLTATVGWYTLGQKHFEGYYLSVVKMPEATYDWWDGTVTTAATTPTGEDLQHGVWIEWYQSGNKKTEAHYDHGVATGKFVWWYENGQKQAEVDYQAGVPSGIWMTWHPNGLKESQAEYHNGQQIGQWMHWDANGKLIEVRGTNNDNAHPEWGTDGNGNHTTNRQPPQTMRTR